MSLFLHYKADSKAGFNSENEVQAAHWRHMDLVFGYIPPQFEWEKGLYIVTTTLHRLYVPAIG